MAPEGQLKTMSRRSFLSTDVNGRGRVCHEKCQVGGLDASIGRREWTAMDVQWTHVRSCGSGNGRGLWTAMDGRHGRAPLSKGRPSVPERTRRNKAIRLSRYRTAGVKGTKGDE